VVGTREEKLLKLNPKREEKLLKPNHRSPLLRFLDLWPSRLPDQRAPFDYNQLKIGAGIENPKAKAMMEIPGSDNSTSFRCQIFICEILPVAWSILRDSKPVLRLRSTVYLSHSEERTHL
jgi:hypothetical protein